MTFSTWFLLRACVPAACATLLSGCYNISPQVKPVAFVDTSVALQNKVMAPVVLVLSKAFVTNRHVLWRGGQSYTFHLGPSLEAYARGVAQSNFRTVAVARSDAPPQNTDAEFILTPEVRKVAVTSFMTVFDTQDLTMDVEWTLKRRGDGNALWLATFAGHGSGKAAKPEIIEQAVADLWKNTRMGFEKLRTLEALKRTTK